MVLAFSSSFVRSSSTETNATNVPFAATVSQPAPVNAVWDAALPRSLYPILPPPQPYYARAQPLAMSRSFSSTNTDSDTTMTEVQRYEDEDDDVDGAPLDATTFANYYLASDDVNREHENIDIETHAEHQDTSSPDFEMDTESEDATLEIVRPTRARAVKESATKAHQPVNKRAPLKRTAKAGRKTATTSEKTSATSGSASDGPARRTRSSTSSQQSKAKITGYDGVDLSPLVDKYKTRKTWTPANKTTLRKAIRTWWTTVGAAAQNSRQKIGIPRGNKDEGWMYIWAECKRLNPNFNHNDFGIATVARKMKKAGHI
ncbi:hypothetical protein FS837_000361 [Tulasnella sp. UAMH 9824]|nr:hypothetical protein FS837_000361 [Tulasnella sp. UAMH 9824]